MNHLTTLCRVAAEVQVRAAGEHKVTEFRVAVDRPGKDGGADFFTVEAWNKTADFLAQVDRKGSRIVLQGRLRQKTWTDKDDNNRERTVIVADRVTFLDRRTDTPATEDGSAGDGGLAATVPRASGCVDCAHNHGASRL